MKNDRLGANVLSMKVIPQCRSGISKRIIIETRTSLIRIVTSDCDDVTYVALD